MKLKLNDIKLNKELTPREGINKSTVGIYENSFDELPPIDVFWIESKDGWWLVDGWHRYEAAKNLGKKQIEASEHQGTLDDAKEFSFDSNLKHGQPLTLNERREAARLKLIRHTERSDNWIGEDCGIADHTVRRLREELEEAFEISKASKFLMRPVLGQKKERWYPRKQEKKEEEKPRVEPVNIYHDDMLKLLPKLGKFDLVIADPPYGVTDWSWDELNKDEYFKKCKQWLKTIKSALKDKYHFFWFCSPGYQAGVEKLFYEMGFPIQSRIVWIRRNMAEGSKAKMKFVDTWEMVIHSGNKPLNFEKEWSERWFDTQVHAVPQSNFEDKKLHPTQKPLALIRLFVEVGSDKTNRILDPFAGAGTTGEACQQDDRQCVLIEIDGGHVTAIENRLKTKRQAEISL